MLNITSKSLARRDVLRLEADATAKNLTKNIVYANFIA